MQIRSHQRDALKVLDEKFQNAFEEKRQRLCFLQDKQNRKNALLTDLHNKKRQRIQAEENTDTYNEMKIISGDNEHTYKRLFLIFNF